MIIRSDRFGTAEVEDSDLIRFPAGIIGFPGEHRFVLLRQRTTSVIGWLQSTTTSWLAIPVVSLDVLEFDPTQFDFVALAEHAGLTVDIASLSVMAVLHATTGAPASVNLLAPVIVNVETRTGAQVLMEGSKLSTQEPFVLRRDLVATPATSQTTGMQPHTAPVVAVAASGR